MKKTQHPSRREDNNLKFLDCISTTNPTEEKHCTIIYTNAKRLMELFCKDATKKN